LALQQALFSAQHFFPAWQQVAFGLAEQQADFALQQASLALQQSATWTPVFAAVLVAHQQQVVALAPATDPFAWLLSPAEQQALASAQHCWPFWQQAAFAPWQQGKFAWQQARFWAQQSAVFCRGAFCSVAGPANRRPNPRIDPAISFRNMEFSPGITFGNPRWLRTRAQLDSHKAYKETRSAESWRGARINSAKRTGEDVSADRLGTAKPSRSNPSPVST
jgi:hypothetical protein